MTLSQAAHEAFEFLRAICPYDTGNMHNTMRYEKGLNNLHRIRINPDNYAPYAVYTNEKWIDQRWHNAHNPNEKWIDEGVQGIVMSLAVKLGGEVTSTVGEKERWENKNYYVAIADGG